MTRADTNVIAEPLRREPRAAVIEWPGASNVETSNIVSVHDRFRGNMIGRGGIAWRMSARAAAAGCRAACRAVQPIRWRMPSTALREMRIRAFVRGSKPRASTVLSSARPTRTA
ncbi:hypothetical protein [Burkholderia paludis]|uniref:hypothetical protein n=1 Tax=Burkholderia paludis TaxID=1506587 RepID=UPI001F231BA7|nr:hypothetical protein [Burkholderia paludis]